MLSAATNSDQGHQKRGREGNWGNLAQGPGFGGPPNTVKLPRSKFLGREGHQKEILPMALKKVSVALIPIDSTLYGVDKRTGVH